MKKKMIVWVMAMAASLCMTMPVAAAPSRGNGRAVNYVDANGDGICDNCAVNGGRGRWFIDKNGDGICDYFTDTDKNGICDHCTRYGGRGRQFVDKNGDGICDNFTGIGNGSGRRCRQGRNRA